MVQHHHILTINPDVYLSQLHLEMSGHLARLRTITQAIEDGSFISSANAPRPGDIVRLVMGIDESFLARSDQVANSRNHCFLDMIRSLIGYMDRMISVRRVAKQTMIVPDGGWSLDDALQALQMRLEREYEIVVRDTTLSNPKKIAQFSSVSVSTRTAALQYFDVRRCLEHHGGIPSKALSMSVLGFKVLADGTPITSLPYQADKGTILEFHRTQSEITLPAAHPIKLADADLEGVYHLIVDVIASEIHRDTF